MKLILFGVLFALIETIYFGCNFYPQSKAEFICDKIALFIVALGCCHLIYKHGFRKGYLQALKDAEKEICS